MRKSRAAWLRVWLILTAWLAASVSGVDVAQATSDAHQEVRGVTVSCPTWGGEWGSDAMVATLKLLKSMGVNWVAIHPYARIGNDGSVRWRHGQEAPRWLRRPIEEAHALGMKIMIKPHLAYWGSGFAWRGSIAFPEDSARTRFFEQYGQWVTHLARVVSDADAFVIGTELDGTVEHDQQWRRIIASVRAVYPGHLTYAANWDQYERVPFWDSLDAIGVQAYFPVVPASVGGVTPTPAQLAAGWQRILAPLRRKSAQLGKPVVFTELGYDTSMFAASQPWRSGTRTSEGTSLQAACLRAALQAIDSEPSVVGAFLWKWFPGEKASSDFSLVHPEARGIITDQWMQSDR